MGLIGLVSNPPYVYQTWPYPKTRSLLLFELLFIIFQNQETLTVINSMATITAPAKQLTGWRQGSPTRPDFG